MRIFITGGTGFIGSHIVKGLASRKHSITVLARDPLKAKGLSSLPGVKVVRADMYDLAAIKKHMKNPDALIHAALCWGDTGPEMVKNETFNSVRLIDLAVKRGAKKIIYTSSTAAAGPIPATVDETARRNPADFYGATKGAVELFLSAYSAYYPKIEFNTVRPGYTFGNPAVEGAPMEPDKRFREIVSKAKAGSIIELIKNDGTQFIWAGDLAKIYSKILAKGLHNEVFYGLAGNFIKWETIARWAIATAKSSSRIKLKDLGWSNNPPFYSVDKIKKYFGLSFNSIKMAKDHVLFLIKNS